MHNYSISFYINITYTHLTSVLPIAAIAIFACSPILTHCLLTLIDVRRTVPSTEPLMAVAAVVVGQLDTVTIISTGTETT